VLVGSGPDLVPRGLPLPYRCAPGASAHAASTAGHLRYAMAASRLGSTVAGIATWVAWPMSAGRRSGAGEHLGRQLGQNGAPGVSTFRTQDWNCAAVAAVATLTMREAGAGVPPARAPARANVTAHVFKHCSSGTSVPGLSTVKKRGGAEQSPPAGHGTQGH